jgi:uncharacterized protein YggE
MFRLALLLCAAAGVAWLPATAVAPVRAADETSAAILSNNITIEGTGAISVPADTMVLEFTIGTTADSAAAASSALSAARTNFTNAVLGVTGNRGQIEFAAPQVSRRLDSAGQTRLFDATQTATLVLTSFPTDRQPMNNYIASIAAAATGGMAVPAGLEGPVATFQVSQPRALEEQLTKAAVADARRRANVVAAALGRQVTEVRSGYFPASITYNGNTIPLASVPTPALSADLNITITYTVQVAFGLGM